MKVQTGHRPIGSSLNEILAAEKIFETNKIVPLNEQPPPRLFMMIGPATLWHK
jgi:hypothetical protein